MTYRLSSKWIPNGIKFARALLAPTEIYFCFRYWKNVINSIEWSSYLMEKWSRCSCWGLNISNSRWLNLRVKSSLVWGTRSMTRRIFHLNPAHYTDEYLHDYVGVNETRTLSSITKSSFDRLNLTNWIILVHMLNKHTTLVVSWLIH